MSENAPRESVVLCEGYHDRAFWAGWLVTMGCQDLRPKPGQDVSDPWNKEVRGGAYAYRSKSGLFLRVVPVHGNSNLLQVAKEVLTNRATRPLSRLVLNLDSDKVADDHRQRTAGLHIHDVKNALQTPDTTAIINADGEIEMDGGATKVALIRWETDARSAAGLPKHQTLERLVCACLCAAYTARGGNVENWLQSRHKPPKPTVKEYAWSYYAGWYANHGTEDFYRCLWDDQKIVKELKARLEDSGAWRIAEALAS